MDRDRKEFRTTGVHIWCFSNRTWLLYLRELPANEVGLASSIRVAAGESEVVLHRGRQENGRELWLAPAGAEFLRNATAVASLMVTEAIVPGNAQHGSPAIKLSTTGLTKLLEILLKECGGSKSSDITGGERKP